MLLQLRKIIHNVAPAFYPRPPREYTVEDEEEHQKSDIAFRTFEGKKYDNVKWQSTESSEKISTFRNEILQWMKIRISNSHSGNSETVRTRKSAIMLTSYTRMPKAGLDVEYFPVEVRSQLNPLNMVQN